MMYCAIEMRPTLAKIFIQMVSVFVVGTRGYSDETTGKLMCYSVSVNRAVQPF